VSRVKVDITADKSGLDTALKGVEHSIEGLKSMVVGAFSVDAIRAVVEKTFDYADAIDKTSLRMKMTTEQTQALSIVAKEAGTSLETVEEAFRKIEAARAKALGGDTASLKAFKALGIDTADLSKPNNTLNLASQLAVAARNGSNDVQGVALQNLGLKRSAGDLAELGDSLTDFGSKVDELKAKGEIIPDSDIANIVRAREELETVANDAMAKIAPVISQIIEGIEEGWIILETTAENTFTAIILMAQAAVEYIQNLKDNILKGGKNIMLGAAKGFLEDGVVGAAIGGATAKDSSGGSVAKSTIDFAEKYGQIQIDAAKQNSQDLTDRLNEYQKGLADKLASRAKARESKPEPAAKVLPPGRQARVYSDALTATGNMIGASFNNAGSVASSLDVQKKQLNSLQTLNDAASKQTDLLTTIAANTDTSTNEDDWN